MKRLLALMTAAALLAGCDGAPVESAPERSEIVGVWRCGDFPSRFMGYAGADPASTVSRITFYEDGRCLASKLPRRSPDGFIDLDSTWALHPGTRTPSGYWSVEVDGYFLQCRRVGEALELRLTISATDNFFARYRRVE